MSQKQDNIIAELDALWATLVARQADHLASHGKHFQGLPSMATVPPGNAEEQADLTRKPADQETDYSDFWRGAYFESNKGDGRPLVKTKKFAHKADVLTPRGKSRGQMTIDISEGPKGSTWSVALRYKQGRDVWIYRRGHDGAVLQDWEIEATPDLPALP